MTVTPIRQSLRGTGWAVAVALSVVACEAIAEPAQAPYQRNAGEYGPREYPSGNHRPPPPRRDDPRGKPHVFRRRPAERIEANSGYFRRPYPYHLDYYRMRYGGSYEPYAGNIYGPPNVVLAPGYLPYGAGFGDYLPRDDRIPPGGGVLNRGGPRPAVPPRVWHW